MKINKAIVLDIEKKTKCPILEMFYTEEDNHWYVCFEEYIIINGEQQIVHLDEVMNELKKYDNIEYFTNEVYYDDTREDTYFEQITFQWEDNMIKHIDEINFSDALDNSDLIRLSNFIELEFGNHGQFEFNNTEGVMEIITDFEMDTREIVDLLYNNNDIKNNDEFLFYDCGNRYLSSENRKWVFDFVMQSINADLCNGEFKEIVEDCLGYQITY